MSIDFTTRAESWIETLAPRIRWLPFGLVLVCAVYSGGFAYRFGHNFAAGSDATGYLLNARLIETGRLSAVVRPVAGPPLDRFHPLVYQPHGTTAVLDDPRLVPTYPFGYPVLLALVKMVSGRPEMQALRWTLVLVALAAPLLVYATARQLGCLPFWSMVAGAMMGLSPLTRFMAIEPMSDLWSLELACIMVIAALRAHRGPGWNVGLGVALIWALHTRLTNGLFMLPVAVAMSWQWRKQRWWWVVILFGAVGVFTCGWMNARLYGSALSTGYGDLESLFSVGYVEPTVRHVARWLGTLISPPLAIGFALSVLAFRRQAGALRLVWVWFGSLVGFYCFYQFTSETWWYTRFILPALPAAAICGCWLWQRVEAKRRPLMRLALRVLVLGWGLHAGAAATRSLLTYTPPADSPYVWLSTWMQTNTMPSDLVVCDQVSASVYFNRPNAIVRYFGLSGEDWSYLQQVTNAQKLTMYCVVFRFEIEKWRAFADHVPGNWKQMATHGDLEIYRLVNE